MDKVYSVFEFIQGINELLAFPVVIEGEVSSFRVSQGRWGFFDLKDEKVESKVNCFIMAYKLKSPLEDGMRIRVYGTPRIYEKSGQFSITVERIELVGEGALKRAYELLFAKLESEGLFAQVRKRPLPQFPKRIGLIASRESAAYSDFIRILNNRWGDVEVVLTHVHVQGAEAVPQIVGALKWFSSADAPEVDVLVMIRGGGSLEDLQAFNAEEVARTLFASRMPTIVGVGHEPDVSIADYVADVRASTPSNAAERVVPDRREIESRVNYALGMVNTYFESSLLQYQHKIHAKVDSLTRIINKHTARLSVLESKLFGQLRHTSTRLVNYSRTLDAAAARLGMKFGGVIESAKSRLSFMVRTMESLNPEAVLARGYGIIRSGGKIIREAGSVQTGSEIQIRLHKGELGANVTSIK